MISDLNPTGNPHYVARFRRGGQAKGIAPGHAYRSDGARTPTLCAKCRCGWEGAGLEEIETHEALARSWKSPSN